MQFKAANLKFNKLLEYLSFFNKQFIMILNKGFLS